jgi:hypothetical protein
MTVALSSLNHLGEEDLAHFLLFGVTFGRVEGREATAFVSIINYQLALLSARAVGGIANVAHYLPRRLRNTDVTAFCEVLTAVQGYHIAFAFNLEMVAVNLLRPNAH